MQKLVIKDDLIYSDLIDWVRLQASFSPVGIGCQRDLFLYLFDELLKVENYCLAESMTERDKLFDDNNKCFLTIDGEQKTIDIQPLDNITEVPNIVCLMEDCADYSSQFYKTDDDNIYICCFKEG